MAWKRRRSERSFSMYLRYSLSVVAPMQEISPRESAGLRMFAASSEPSAEPAPISEWISSMKTMRSWFSFSSLRIPLRRSSNWPRYFVPGDDEREVEREDLPLREEERNAALDDPLREALDDRRLADARLAEEDRVVLRAAREDLDDPLDLLVAPDERVERALLRERGQVARVLGEERQLLLLLRRLALLDERDRLLAHAVQVEAVRHQDAARDARVDAQDADEKVLRADVGMHHRLRLVRGVGEDLLRLLRERQLLRGGDALDEDAVALDLAADLVGLHVEAGEDLLDDLLALAEDAEQDVLGLDDLGAELRRLVPGEEQGPARLLVVLFEHRQMTVSTPRREREGGPRRIAQPLFSQQFDRSTATRPFRVVSHDDRGPGALFRDLGEELEDLRARGRRRGCPWARRRGGAGAAARPPARSRRAASHRRKASAETRPRGREGPRGREPRARRCRPSASAAPARKSGSATFSSAVSSGRR